MAGFPARANLGYLGFSSVVLMRGPRNVLFDTGTFGSRSLLREKLASLGLGLDDVDAVALSHLHFDHVQNAFLFKRARLYVHEIELNHARTRDSDDLYPEGIAEALEGTGRLVAVSGDLEVEPGVWAFRTPGHTPGCISCLVSARGRKVVMAGDAAKNAQELMSSRPEMAVDFQAAKRSIDSIRRVADEVIPGHDSPVDLVTGKRLIPLEIRVTLSRGICSAAGAAEASMIIE